MLDQILEEAGYSRTKKKTASPKFIRAQRVTAPLPLAHAKV
jgi:hypothetical protein